MPPHSPLGLKISIKEFQFNRIPFHLLKIKPIIIRKINVNNPKIIDKLDIIYNFCPQFYHMYNPNANANKPKPIAIRMLVLAFPAYVKMASLSLIL